MTPTTDEILRRLSMPLEPLPTTVSPRLEPIRSLRAILWDIYGTLVVSACGDIGSTGLDLRAEALQETLDGLCVPTADFPAEEVIGIFLQTIASHHNRARSRGVDYPEVNILEVWADVWGQLVRQGSIGSEHANIDLSRLSTEFEGRANRVALMPGVERVLDDLRQRKLIQGLVSNAQFFTPALFPALLNRSLTDLGFDRKLRYYSYEHGHAKPSLLMYELARDELLRRSVSPREVLFIGNDMKNDILPASQVGFRTALFAGDARSLRMRHDDPQLSSVEPDAILTELIQIQQLVEN